MRVLSDLGKELFDSPTDKIDRLEESKTKYRSYSDEKLIQKFKNTASDSDIAAITIILKERGYELEIVNN